MTDNEIIKALECCSQEDMCQSCPYGAACLDEKYVSVLSKDALDLIKRQKAEIERLQYIKKHINDVILEDCVLETPEAYNMSFQKLIKKLTNTKAAKSEAIKEFAERYEKAVLPLLTSATLDKKDGIHACLDILKEMAGDVHGT